MKSLSKSSLLYISLNFLCWQCEGSHISLSVQYVSFGRLRMIGNRFWFFLPKRSFVESFLASQGDILLTEFLYQGITFRQRPPQLLESPWFAIVSFHSRPAVTRSYGPAFPEASFHVPCPPCARQKARQVTLIFPWSSYLSLIWT